MATKTATAKTNTNGKVRSKATKTTNKTKAPPVARIRQAIMNAYGVKLSLRDQRITSKVYHALQQKLGLDLQAQLGKINKKLDWKQFKEKVFPKLFGTPENPKFSVKEMGEIAAQLYDTVPKEPEAAIAHLIEENRKSLERLNKMRQQDEKDVNLDDLDDLDEPSAEEEDEFDEEEDEDEEELDDLDEPSAEEEDEFDDEEENEEEEEDDLDEPS